MYHLNNINELILYSSLSCMAAFLGRLYPSIHFPIILLRCGILLYCAYVIAIEEGNKPLAIIIGGSVFLGSIGGYWDLIEIYLRYNIGDFHRTISVIVLIAGFVLGLMFLSRDGKNGRTGKE